MPLPDVVSGLLLRVSCEFDSRRGCHSRQVPTGTCRLFLCSSHILFRLKRSFGCCHSSGANARGGRKSAPPGRCRFLPNPRRKKKHAAAETSVSGAPHRKRMFQTQAADIPRLAGSQPLYKNRAEKRSTQLLKRPFPVPRTANGRFRRKPRMCRGLQVHN